MDSALYLPKEEIVSAEELCDWETVDEKNFICPSCAIAVEPVSYKEGMKRRPYFRLYKNTRHTYDCGIDGQERLTSIAKYKPISNEDGFPIPYPNKMILPATREQVPTAFEPSTQKDKSTLINGYETTDNKNRKKHNRTTTTIRPIARQFIQFPYDRHLELIIEGINLKKYNTYSSVFERLQANKAGTYTDKRIFYGSLYIGHSYEKKPDTTNLAKSFVINLTQGHWQQSENKMTPIELYQVAVDCSTWTTRTINTIKKEMEIAIKETQQASRERWNERKKIKTWLFFIGDQDRNNPFLFHINNHRLICCLMADNL